MCGFDEMQYINELEEWLESVSSDADWEEYEKAA